MEQLELKLVSPAQLQTPFCFSPVPVGICLACVMTVRIICKVSHQSISNDQPSILM